MKAKCDFKPNSSDEIGLFKGEIVIKFVECSEGDRVLVQKISCDGIYPGLVLSDILEPCLNCKGIRNIFPSDCFFARITKDFECSVLNFRVLEGEIVLAFNAQEDSACVHKLGLYLDPKSFLYKRISSEFLIVERVKNYKKKPFLSHSDKNKKMKSVSCEEIISMMSFLCNDHFD